MSNYNRPEFSCMKSVVHIDWSESLNSGLSEVDEQHRTLVGLINDLGVYHGGGAAVSEVLTVFQKLEHYSVYHFESEESLMRDHGVCEKDYQEHCRSHRAFVTLLQQARGLVATCPDEVVQQLTAYLLKWLVFHIGGEDMRMAHAIVARSGEGRSIPEVPTWKLDGTLVSMVNDLYDDLGQRTLEMLRLNTQLRDEHERFHRLAHFDALTGLPNRLLFRIRAEQALNLARQQGARLAFLYLDLNRFKPVNDEYGHDVGDALLKELALRLQACIRDHDIACRQGGDEFLVLLTEVSAFSHVCQVSRRISQALGRSYVINDLPLRVGVSIGVSYFPDHGEDLDTLVSCADGAMYLAKAQGGGCASADDRRCSTCH